MKTRMHRFWLSVTLAAGALASPLSSQLSAHDLPWRWSSDTVSSSDWNYLRDDCLDSRTLSRYGDSLSRSLEGSLSTCPTEDEVANRFDDALAHQAAAKFADEMACWASKWETMQKKAGEVARASLVSQRQEVLNQWAARPDFGVPPAPSIPIVDTCGFGAEYLAMQAAADLLDAEVARADAISAKEAEMNRALAAAAEIEAAAIDTISESDLALANASESNDSLRNDFERSLCGGESNEIVSQQRPHSDFAPPVDEYMAYDLDGRDAHWMGGLSKSWRLRAAISAAAAADAVAEAAESFGADELLEEATVASSNLAESPENASEIIEAPSDSEFALCDFVGPIASSSELAAQTLAASELIAAKPDAGLAPAPSSSELALKDRLADGLEWLDQASCVVAAEMCGMDGAHRLGERWGELSLAAAQQSMTTYVAMGQYVNLPPTVYEPTPDLEPRSDVYVVYTDAQGDDTVVPSTLAPAWNAGQGAASQSNASLDEANYLHDELAAYGSGNAADVGAADAGPAGQPAASSASQPTALLSGINLAQLRRHVLSLVARELDAIGMSCLQTADQLSNWADPQIASRDDSDVR